MQILIDSAKMLHNLKPVSTKEVMHSANSYYQLNEQYNDKGQYNDKI